VEKEFKKAKSIVYEKIPATEFDFKMPMYLKICTRKN